MNNFLEEEIGTKTENKICYLNGILSTIEVLNDGLYTGNTFYFAQIENISNNFEKSILNHLKGPSWNIKMNKIENFEINLDNTLSEYCKSYVFSIIDEFGSLSNMNSNEDLITRLLKRTNYTNLIHNLKQTLTLILGLNFETYSIIVSGEGWYEASYNDYFFVCLDDFYYLHFGLSD